MLLQVKHPAFGALAGLRWSQRDSYCQYIPDISQWPQQDSTTTYVNYGCIYPLSQVYATLIVQAVGWLLLAVYLDNVYPGWVLWEATWPATASAVVPADGQGVVCPSLSFAALMQNINHAACGYPWLLAVLLGLLGLLAHA